MNRSIAMTTLLIATVAVGGCRTSDQRSIVGTWTGKTHEGYDVVLTFTAHGTLKAAVDDDAGEGTYQVDFSKKPPHLDIDWGSRGKVETILQLLDEKQLRVENSDPGEDRPETFTKAALVLTRKR
jgi:hypothetical protein